MAGSPVLDVALVYGPSWKWRVVPVLPGTKRPAISDWPEAATTDEGTIRRWWERDYVGCGIGVVCGAESGLLVIDIDDGPGKFGSDSLEDYCQKHGRLPDSPTCLTPSGGRHIYVRWPGYSLAQDALGPDIDVQGEGRFVVAPPSVHPNGGTYAWEHSLRPSQVSLAELNGWLPAPSSTSAGGDGERDLRFDEILTSRGWTLTKVDKKGQAHYIRPGKERREGESGTVYPFPDSHFTCYSTSAALPVGVPLGPNKLAELFGTAGPEATTSGTEQPGRLYVIEWGDKIAPERPEWVWPDYLAKNIFQVVIGRQGGGKSTFASWVIGQCTTGSRFPGGDPLEPMVCLYLSLEEPKGRIIARLKANGSDVSKVAVMGRELADLRPWRLPASAGVLEQAIGDNDVRLAVIDGVGYCVEGQQDYPTIAAACSLLAGIAEKTGSTIVGLTHPPKGQSDPVTAAIGSTAWTAVPRLTWLIGRDPDDESVRVLRVGKTAYREPDAGFGFVILSDDAMDAGKVVLTGPSSVPASALVAGMRSEREQSKRAEVAELLTEWTQSGPIAVEEVRHRLKAEDLDVSHPTLRRAAREAGLVTSEPDGKGGPRYFLRPDQTPPTEKDS